jgi:hypothetical protein
MRWHPRWLLTRDRWPFGPRDDTPEVHPYWLMRPRIKSRSDERDRLDYAKDILQVLQAIFAIAGIYAATWWFLEQGEGYTRVNVTLSVVDRRLDDHWTYLRVAVRATNAGKRPVWIEKSSVRLHQILPLGEKVRLSLNSSPGSLVDENQGDVLWFKGDERSVSNTWSVAVGETDTRHFGFIIPNALKTVEIYAELTGREDRKWIWGSARDDFVWKVSKLHDPGTPEAKAREEKSQ